MYQSGIFFRYSCIFAAIMKNWLIIIGLLLFLIIGCWVAINNQGGEVMSVSDIDLSTTCVLQSEHAMLPTPFSKYLLPVAAETAETPASVHYAALQRIWRTDQARYISSLKHCLSLLSLCDGVRASQCEKLYVTTLSKVSHLTSDYYVFTFKCILI